MRLEIGRKAFADLRWFKDYYIGVFPEGRRKANRHFDAAMKVLLTDPQIGKRASDFPGAKEFLIPKTPFCILYQVEGDVIRVVRIFDQRSEFSNDRV